MLEKARFDGYRLLDKFEADLGQLTVVIGANATGKSTLLDALSLITQAVDWPVEEVVLYQGGMDAIGNRSGSINEISWQLTMAKPLHHPMWKMIPIDQDQRLVYEGKLGRDLTGKLQLVSECLRNEKPFQGYKQPLKLIDVYGDKAMIWDSRQKKLRSFNQPTDPIGRPKEKQSSQQPEAQQVPASKVSLLLSQMRFINEYPLATWIRGLLANYCFYPGFDVTRNSPVRTKLSEIKPLTTLSWSGENLGTVFHEILTRHDYRDMAEELNNFLAVAYPHIDSISAETAYGGEPRVLVRIREAGFNRATELWELSDGMLRFLLLSAALLNPLPPPFVAIDEPEAGLHPKLLPIVADMIRMAAEKTQVLVTTHSPQLVNSFGLDDIAVLTREGTRAVWTRPGNRASLRKMLLSQLGGSLGDLHAAGELEALR